MLVTVIVPRDFTQERWAVKKKKEEFGKGVQSVQRIQRNQRSSLASLDSLVSLISFRRYGDLRLLIIITFSRFFHLLLLGGTAFFGIDITFLNPLLDGVRVLLDQLEIGDLVG